MAKSTKFKSVVVKEDPKTSLAEAGISSLRLTNGMRVVTVGHANYPNHDRPIYAQVLNYLRDSKPAVTILLGSMIDEDAFRALLEEEENYLHEVPDAPEVQAARALQGMENQVMALGKSCGDFIKSFADASGGRVIYIPSATHLSMGNEVRIIEAIQQKKRVLDNWSANHADAPETPSDPTIELPKKLAKLLQIDEDPRIITLRYGAAVKVNGKVLFMIGDFRRRHPGDAAKVEWEQRGCDIVRSFDGKLASAWMTTPKHSLPGLVLNFWQFHEVGYLWDSTRMGHLRDYDRRALGFWTGVSYEGELFGQSVPVIRGEDGRRSFVVDGVTYTEDTPGALPNGSEITLLPAATAPEIPVTKPQPAARKPRKASKRAKR